jgi:hypothetical protein
MILGFTLFVVGYTVFYWALGHFPGNTRYSLWVLFGFGTLWPKVNIPGGTPIVLSAA